MKMTGESYKSKWIAQVNSHFTDFITVDSLELYTHGDI
jgi:hypothetical protein